MSSYVHIGTSLTIQNASRGFYCTRLGLVSTNNGSNIVFNNVGIAWYVETGSMIASSTPVSNITYTNVTTKCSQTVGQFNANGFIGGTLQN